MLAPSKSPTNGTLYRNLKALCLAFSVLCGAVLVGVVWHRDRLTHLMLQEVARQTRAPFQAREASLQIVRCFPHAYLVMHDVTFSPSLPEGQLQLEAQEVVCAFNLWDLACGRRSMSHLRVRHGTAQILYQGAADKSTSEPWSKRSHLPVPQLHLEDVALRCGSGKWWVRFWAQKLEINAHHGYEGLRIELRGTGKCQGWQKDDLSSRASEVSVRLRTELTYGAGQLKLHPTQLFLEEAQFSLQGNLSTNRNGLDRSSGRLTVRGQQIRSELLLRCLPNAAAAWLKLHRFYGRLDTQLDIERPLDRSPVVRGTFQLAQASLQPLWMCQPFVLGNVSGKISASNAKRLETFVVHLDKMQGRLATHPWEMKGIVLRDFTDPHVQGSASALLQLQHLSALFRNSPNIPLHGTAKAAIELNTRLSNLAASSLTKDQLYGTLTFQDVQCVRSDSTIWSHSVNGQIDLRGSRLHMDRCVGTLKEGSFHLRGVLHNAAEMIRGVQPPRATLQLESDCLDVTDFAALSTSSSVPAKLPSKTWSAPAGHIQLHCRAKKLVYKRLLAEQLDVVAEIKDQCWNVSRWQMLLADGRCTGSGWVDTLSQTASGRLLLEKVSAKQLLRMGDDFHQTLITHHQVDGSLSIEARLEAPLGASGGILWKSARATGKVQWQHGRLRQFAPARKLSRYFTSKTLDDLKFSVVNVPFRLEDNTIHIPSVEIGSNLTRIRLVGTHTLDGQMTYRLTVPLSQSASTISEAVRQQAGTDALTGINLFLLLEGRTDNYRISYDVKALKESIQSSLRAQGKVLQDVWQGKPLPALVPKQELSEEDYFDFD